MSSDHLYPHPSRPSRNESDAAAEAEDAPAVFSLLADPATIASGQTAEAPLAPSPSADSASEVLPSQELGRKAERVTEVEVALTAEETSAPVNLLAAAKPIESDESPITTPPLIDAATARRLAADARARERASRAALLAAQREFAESISLNDEVDASAEFGTVPEQSDAPNEPEAGWTRRPMVARGAPTPLHAPAPFAQVAEEPTSAEPHAAMDSPEPQRQPLGLDASQTKPSLPPVPTALEAEMRELRQALRLANADRKELEATLAMARQSTQQQRAQIAQLKARQNAQNQDEAESAVSHSAIEATPDTKASPAQRELTDPAPVELATPPPTSENGSPAPLTRSATEIAQMIERLDVAERNLETRTTEKQRLEVLLEERDALLATHRSQLDKLRDRLDAQDRALDGARREYEAERTRHTVSLEILNQLRETLGGSRITEACPPQDSEVTPSAPSLHEPHATAAAPLETRAQPILSESTSEIHHALISPAEPTSETETLAPATEASSTSSSPLPVEDAPADLPDLPAPKELDGRTFKSWIDDQVRRHFGPIGVDRLSDLLLAPLERRNAHKADGQSILLVGFNAARVSEQIAQELLEASAPPFILHAADTRPTRSRRDSRLPSDAPLYDFLTSEDAPADPAEFKALIERVQPSVVVLRDFLSREPDRAAIDAWLEVLETAAKEGLAVVLAESTGLAMQEPPEEMRAIGERIWDRLPGRYTQVNSDTDSLSSWQDAFEARFAQPANALRNQSRERLRFELFAQFGFLAESFVRSPIEANFDPEAARDRRFLAQVADLDDRKIEAGIAPALHFVGRVDPLAEA